MPVQEEDYQAFLTELKCEVGYTDLTVVES
ncbi:hypothetical protein CI610_02723 [invertebrate metagenome]|uniref:Uncharacterized protein n=1 Tax=invertebrate metagenome TaxID=1711999 RepID=A0A2H9T560_9ZZZZ